MRVFARTSVCLSVFSAAALLLCSISATASLINVVNGSFTSLSNSTPGTSGKLGTGTGEVTVNGWTSTGYNFVYSGASTTNANGQYGNASGISLWGVTGGTPTGPGAGTNPTYCCATGGTPNGIGVSPDGGNFIAMDGAYEQGPISQSISGLTIGEDTKVSFYYAGAQQSGFTGITTEAFQVTLGSQMDSTATLTNASHGFTGWQYVTLDFVPTAATETLSFLAVGTPGGQPPFSLLDGVSVVQVTPEPSSLALLGTGILAIGGMMRRRRQAA